MKGLIIIASTLALAACGKSGNNNGNQGEDGGNPGSDAGVPLDSAASPTFSPPGGIYTTAQTVTISCSTAGATIYYTTDGSEPTKASTRYTAPVSVSSYRILKAIATAPGYADSVISTATYGFETPTSATEAPTFSPAAGSYASAQSVTISSATAGAILYYTTDGSDPTTASTRYAAPISVAQSQTLRAFASAAGRTPSAIASASYIIGGNVTYMAGCTAFQAKFLSLYASCFKANPLFVEWMYGESTCAATQKEIDQGRVSYDAAKGATCAAAIANLTCDFVYGKAALPAECSAMMTGKVAENGTCYSSDDCQSGFCSSEMVDGTCPGTCKPFVVADASCADGAWCEAGLECFQDVCKKPSVAGGACPCQAGFWCERTDLIGSGTCKAVLSAGAACVPLSCAPGLICAGEPATCKALAGEGDACTPADGLTECGEGYHCDTTTKKCVSDPSVGRACTSDVFCINAYCDETTTPSAPVCKALVEDGGACTDEEQCVSFSCTSGKCDAAGDRSCLAP